MKFQDFLYMHGFANVEWQISKDVYIELSKHFNKDIFEEVIKYCYETYDHLTIDNISDDIGNTLLLVETDRSQFILVFRCLIPEEVSSYNITGDILLSFDEDDDSFCSILLSDSKIILYSTNNPRGEINYKRIIIYKYHEINEIRIDKEKVRKLIEQRIFEDKKRLLSYCANDN